MTRINAFTINGVSQKAALRNVRVTSEVNTPAQVLTASLLSPVLTATPVVGQAVNLKANNGAGTAYNVMWGLVTKVDETGHTISLEAQSHGMILNRLLQTDNMWYDVYGPDLVHTMQHVIQSDSSGLTASYSGVSTRELSSWTPNRHSKTECLRRLIQLSQIGANRPWVFYQAGGTVAKYVRLEKLASESAGSLATGEAGNIIGRPKWESFTDELINDITVKYDSGVYQATDATSISTYGRKAQTVYRPDMGATDAAALASNILYEWKAPRQRVTAEVLWSAINNPATANYPVLAKNYAVTDDYTGYSGNLAATKWVFKWPGNTDTLVLGSSAANTAEYLRSTTDFINDVNRYGTTANVASDTVIVDHAAETVFNLNYYTPIKTITFPSGLRPNYRVKFDIRSNTSGAAVFAVVYRGSVPITKEFSHNQSTYVTKTVDLNTPLEAGETLSVWARMGLSIYTGYMRNFQVCQTGTLTAPPYSLS